jgi:hypothetical protein
VLVGASDRGLGWPALAVVAVGAIARLDPGQSGLTAQVLVPGSGTIAASGTRLVVWRGDQLVVFEGPARTTTATPAGLARLAGGRDVAWTVPGALGWFGAEGQIPIAGDIASLALGAEAGVAWVGTSDALIRVENGVSTRFETGGRVERLAVGPLDADGCEDIAIASADLPRVALARGNCGGAVAAAVVAPAPAPAPPPAPVPVAAPVPAPVVPRSEPTTYRSSLPSVLADVRCELLVGASYGLWDSSVDGSQAWSQVGDDPGSGPERESSVALGGLCGGGRGQWRWVLGAGLAPSIGLGGAGEMGYADAGAEVGRGDVVGGPFIEVRPVVGLGGRLRLTPVHFQYGRPFGAELRLVGIPGETTGFLGTASLSYGLGRYRPVNKQAW